MPILEVSKKTSFMKHTGNFICHQIFIISGKMSFCYHKFSNSVFKKIAKFNYLTSTAELWSLGLYVMLIQDILRSFSMTSNSGRCHRSGT